MSVNLKSQFELAVKASLGEDSVQESVEQTLIKLVVNATAIDGLGHEGLQSCPGDFVWSDVLTTLCFGLRF